LEAETDATIATVAAAVAAEVPFAGTAVPQVRQKRLLSGISDEHAEHFNMGISSVPRSG
jgi:hypothetical protein